MLIGLQIYFILASFLLFFYAIQGDKNGSISFGYAIAINIFPLAFLPYFSMDFARIIGVPLAYIPIISAGFALIIRVKFKIAKFLLPLIRISLIFLFYSLFTTVIIGGWTFKNFAYWFAWVLNFILFFSAASFFSIQSMFLIDKIIKSTLMIIILGCFVGVLRYLTGIAIDSNFMPVVNRNGTVVIISLLVPSIFYLKEKKKIGSLMFRLSLVIVFLNLILMFSRSGIIGFFAGVLLYHMKFKLSNAIRISVFFFFVYMFLSLGIGGQISNRLTNTVKTIQFISSGNELNNSMSDYNRVMLINAAFDIIKENFWFGTGLGLDNYRIAFHKVSDHFHDSKAHNFYISYLAELGIIGFLIIINFFKSIYTSLVPFDNELKFFKVSFIVIAIMMTMNEYILLPEIWFFLGIGVGVSNKNKYEIY